METLPSYVGGEVMIPKNWRQSVLGDHIELITGFPFKSSEYTDAEDGINLLRGDNVIQGSLRWTNAKKWPEYKQENLDRFQMRSGDFVIAMDRTWVNSGLKASMVTTSDLPCLLVQRVARLRPQNDLHEYFLSLLVRSYHFEQYVKGVQTETAVPHISSKQIHEFPVLLPPLPEQKAIAGVLSVWDAAISTTERLILAKEKQFKWLLNTLFNQGSEKGEWKKAKLGEVANIAKKEKLISVDGEILLTVKLHCLGIAKNDRIKPKLTERGRPYFKRYTGEFLIGRQNFHNGGFGIIPAQLDGLIASNAITSLEIQPNQLDETFLFHLFSNPNYYKRIGHIMDGTGQKELSDKQILKLELSLPPLPEQKRIAETLNTAQREIDLLKKLAAKQKEQKRGLMQKLLTGEWRVKVGKGEG